MKNKVITTGIEIYPSVDEISADLVFGFIEEIMSNLDFEVDENEDLHFLLTTNFHGNRPATSHIHKNGNWKTQTEDTVMRIIDRSAKKFACQHDVRIEVSFDNQYAQ